MKPHGFACNLFTAACYLLTGMAGIWLADSSGLASPIWPPSGFALAAILIAGPRILPGILAGSFAVTLYHALHVHHSLGLLNLVVATAVATAAVLQALLGSRLIRHCVREPNPLESAGSIVTFIVLGGPVSCVVSATLSNLTLLGLGFVPLAELPGSWITWWAGDTMGVAVFTPTLLLLFSRDLHVPAIRKWVLASALILCVACSALLFTQSRHAESRTARTEFDRRCSEMLLRFQNRVQVYDEMMLAVEHWIHSQPGPVTQEAFCAFTGPFLANKPEVQCIGWNLWVPGTELAALERQMHAQGYPDYQVHQRFPDGTIGPPLPAAFHVPVACINPLSGNEKAFGLDTYALDPLGGDGRRRAIDAARETGLKQCTSRVSIVQDETHQNAVLVMHPVFAGDQHPVGLDARKASLRGFVVTVFFVRHLIESVLGTPPTEGKDLLVTDEGAHASRRLLYSTFAEDQRSHTGLPALKKGQLEHTATLSFGNRGWQFTFRETRAAQLARKDWISWAVLLASLSFSFLLNLLLLILTGHAAHTERLVENRTRELESTRDDAVRNAKLASLGMLASGISHEINNPLAIIHAHAENLHMFTEKGNADPQRTLKTTSTILTTTRRISSIIDGLKRYSRDESHLPPRPVLVRELIDDTLSLCREKFHSRGVVLETTCSVPGEYALCRSTEISQVLVNLLNNSFHEVLERSEKWIRLEVIREHGFLLFSVTDSGTGIDPALRTKLFDPFFTTKTVGMGTGLGLSISAGIVASHGGRLWVDETCANTRFVFSVPVAPAPNAAT